MNSRVRLLFRRKTSSATRSVCSFIPSLTGKRIGLMYPLRVYTSNPASVNPVNSSYLDLESHASTPKRQLYVRKESWAQRLLPFSRRHSPRCDGMVSSHNLSGPSNTVATNAWADASASRGSNEFDTSNPKDFIRVKQVICQESEKTE